MKKKPDGRWPCAKCGEDWNIEHECASATETKTQGVKFDDGKPKLSLLSTRWLLAVGEVLNYGAKKYAPDNWRKGMKHRRLIDASLRHLLAYSNGDDVDPESGLPHLAHLACSAMFLYELSLDRPEDDDRWKKGRS